MDRKKRYAAKDTEGGAETVRRRVSLLLAALLLSLVPILLVGDCAHPFGDDYSYSEFVHHALEDGDSLIGAVCYTVRRYWFGWQGTYAGTVLMSLQPGLISEQAYCLTPVVMLLALFLSTGFLTHTVLRRWLRQSRAVWLGATAGLLLVTIQYQPDVMEAFFWWNGAVYYTGFYALMLVLITCLIRLRLEPEHPGLLMAAALVLAAAVGGGNYVTGLLSCLLLAGYSLACLLWDRRRLWQPAATGAVLLAGFLVNTLAPGNAVRQGQSAGMSAVRAVGWSILRVGWDGLHWLHLPTLAMLLCFAPLLWRALEKTEFSFPAPAAVTVLLFLIAACQNAPHYYALGTSGSGRLRDIVYNSCVLLLVVAEGYWLGWLRRRRKEWPIPKTASRGLAVLALVLAVGGFALSDTSTRQCVQALADGSARTYDAHINGWIEVLSDPDADPVVVEQLPVYPPLLHSFNLTQNPESFPNVAAANYYRKSSVTALPPDGA